MWLKDSLPRQELQNLLTKLIERVPVFAGFDQVELLELLNGAEKKVFRAGEQIIREGNTGNFMYVVIDGEARVTKRGDHHKSHELGVFGSGGCFGEMSLVDHAPRSATVEATRDCVLIRIRESDCWRNTKVGSKIFRNIAGILAQRLRELHGVVLDSANSPP
ncbi:MAG: Crp/Fnr family transcriptional regulator [Betaproteobacteria bacterium]